MVNELLDSQVQQEMQRLSLFLNELFPDPKGLTLMVTAEQQQAELKQLREGLRTEQFFLVVDLLSMRIVEAAGLEELGYQSSQFTFRQYLSAFPTQGMLQLITLLGKQSFSMSDQAMVTFMNPKYVSSIPMTCANGQVMLIKRMISPWQFSSTGLLTAYVSEYTIMQPYNNEPLNPRFINMPPAVEAQFSAMMAQVFAHLPARINRFAHKEISLLKLYVEKEGEELPVPQIALMAGIKPNTVRTYNQRIMAKAKTMFGSNMNARTAREVALFLKQSGMLG